MVAISHGSSMVQALTREMIERFHGFKRDLAMVLGGFRGKRPSPLIPRAERPVGLTPFGTQAAARPLRVVSVDAQTPSSISLVLEDPGGQPIEFVAGQFFTVLVDINGTIHRRAYSGCNPTRDRQNLRLTAKRVEDGVVSNYLADELRAGATLPVLGPSGNFTFEPRTDESRHIVLIGGGSGITPLFSILIEALEMEPKSRVTLLYGNRNIEEIIFRDELDDLTALHPRLTVRHVLAEPPSNWTQGKGILDSETIRKELNPLWQEISLDDVAGCWVCGPAPMMDSAREALESAGLPSELIFEERFTQPHLRKSVDRPTEAFPVTIRSNGDAREFLVEPGQSILDAGLAAGLSLRYSCAMGGCAECRLKLVEGEVGMDEPNCLTDSERDAGWVLGCVGWPLSDVVLEVAS